MSYLMNTVTPNEHFKIHTATGQNLLTTDGRLLIDWFMDTGTVSLGYRPLELVSLISEYTFPHLPNMVTYPMREHVAERLCRRARMDKVFFCNSGTEAVEAAIKIARKSNYDKRRNRSIIWTAKGGFHGRTYGALSAGDGARYHTEGFEPLLGGFKHFENPEDIKGEAPVAIMLAPIFGNNDVREYSLEWMNDIFDMAEQYDFPIIFDEVQTGSFRTGCFTAAQLYGFEPDIICLGKGMACGIPTGATLARNEYAEVLTPGSHFSTFGGSPLSMLGISTLLEANQMNKLSRNIAVRGNQIREGLERLKCFGVSEIRGRGLMIAIEFEAGLDSRVFSEALLKHEMFVPTFRKNTMKFAPPLNMSYNDVEQGLARLTTAFSEVLEGQC